MKRLLVTFMISACFIPTFAAADVTVQNNTDQYGVAKLGILCSSIARSRGTIQPRSPFVVPSGILKTFCKTDCHVKIYNSKHCDKDKLIAEVTVNYYDGVTQITNRDEREFNFTGGGNYVEVSYAANPMQKLFNLFF